jgi:hypothetical protein
MSELAILRESPSCRIALCTSGDGVMTAEILVRPFPPGEIDMASLQRAVAMLNELQERGFHLSFQDEGWVSCEKILLSAADASMTEISAILEGNDFI